MTRRHAENTETVLNLSAQSIRGQIDYDLWCGLHVTISLSVFVAD